MAIICKAVGERIVGMRGYKLSYLLSFLMLAGALIAAYYDNKKPKKFRNEMGAYAFFTGGVVMMLIGYREQQRSKD